MDSTTYWRNRETEQRKHDILDGREYQRHIEEIYQNMIDEIEKEINGFYGKYARKEGITMAEAKKRAAKLDIEAYGRKAAKYVKEKNFSKQANEEMRLYNLTMKVNRLELLKAQIGLEMVAGFDEMEKYFGKILTDKAVSEFERQAGILGKTIQSNAKAANAIVNASFHNATYSDRIWMYQDMLKNELSSLLQTGLIQGQNPRRLATHLQKRFGVSQSNAERLMITELARVQTEAQKQSFERNGFEEYTFLALGTACPICRALDGKHFKVKKMMPGTNAPPMHPRCVFPNTKVIAPDIEAMTRSSYSGCVVEIGTSDGARLTVTPNHIVLTARGWVRAKNLIKGDKVINYSRGIKSVIESDPTDNDGIPTIEELFTSLLESGAVPALSMPISSEDFKGDAPSDGEIDIIFIDGKLRNKLNVTLSQLVGDVLLVGASESGEVTLPRNCSLAEQLVGLGLAADGIMSGSRIAAILLRGTLTHSQLIGLRLPSDYDARLYKTAANDTSADIKLFGDGIFAHPGSIHISDLLDIKRDFNSLKRNTASLETALDGRFCDSVGLCDFISAFSGFVTFDDIIFVTNKYYSGHVYDASSLSTLYIANGIITSNCRCSVAAYEDSEDYEAWLNFLDKGGTTEEWNKLKKTRKSVAKNSGSGIINALSTKEDVQVHSVGRINRDIYKCITEDIVTDEVIITENQMQHILDRHPDAYAEIIDYLSDIIRDPDFIIEDKHDNTGLVIKRVKLEKEYAQMVLRICTSDDNPNYKNSVISCWEISEKRLQNYLRNKRILYKKE